MSPFFQIFLLLLRLEEGCRLTAYKDSRGIWTIGWGYNMVAHEYEADECEGVVWTQERADRELVASLNRVLAALDANWPTWRSLDVVRQAVCVSGVYQLGSRKAAKFVNTIAALKAHDWESAARQLLKSQWATQTPERVHRNAVMLRTGSFPETINGQAFHPEGEAAAAVAFAPIEPATPVLPAQGLRPEQGASPAVGEKVGKPLPIPRSLTVGGVRISKKLSVFIGCCLLIVLNQRLGWGLTVADIRTIMEGCTSYILGQAGVDVLAPVLGPVLRSVMPRIMASLPATGQPLAPFRNGEVNHA